MTDPVLEELLASEGLSADGLDDLVAWAKGRAAELAAEAADDPELGPLLSGAVGAGETRPVSHSDATTEPRAEAPTRAEALLEAETPVEAEAQVVREADAPEVPVRTGQTQPNAAAPMPIADAPSYEPSYAGTVGDAFAEAALAELATPHGSGPLPAVADELAAAGSEEEEIEELDDVELLDDDELELVEDEGPTEGSQAGPPPAPPSRAADAPSYGPPDGTEEVPEWKAALYSAELGDDRAAAQKIKEESYVGPVPEDLPEPEPVHSQRLVAEEDEISQHKIDLSDLDGDPEAETSL